MLNKPSPALTPVNHGTGLNFPLLASTLGSSDKNVSGRITVSILGTKVS